MKVGKVIAKFVQYCGGLTFVTCMSVLVVYAVHGWTWNSKFAGGRITLTLLEFVIVIVLVTLPVAICIDVWRSRHLAAPHRQHLVRPLEIRRTQCALGGKKVERINEQRTPIPACAFSCVSH